MVVDQKERKQFWEIKQIPSIFSQQLKFKKVQRHSQIHTNAPVLLVSPVYMQHVSPRAVQRLECFISCGRRVDIKGWYRGKVRLNRDTCHPCPRPTATPTTQEPTQHLNSSQIVCMWRGERARVYSRCQSECTGCVFGCKIQLQR